MIDNPNRTAVEDLGYEVSIAYDGDGWTVWSIQGFGVVTSLRHDDDEAWLRLIATHDERTFQVENPDAMFAAMVATNLERAPGEVVWTDQQTKEQYTPDEVIVLAQQTQALGGA